MVHFLQQIAGDADKHITLKVSGEDKYKVHHTLCTLDLCCDYLCGDVCAGANLRYWDGSVRAICYDGDSEESWARLKSAAEKLWRSGAQVFLETSPHRGGHLWIVFDALVNAEAALATAVKHAPELAGLEAFPGSNQVRLPGGRYRRKEIDAWCQLRMVGSGGGPYTGPAAISVMADHLTPASWVTEPAEAPARERETRIRPPLELDMDPVSLDDDRALPIAVQDRVWQANHGAGRDRLLFCYTPAQVAAWYSARHPLSDILPLERNGYALAQWRDERTASVKFYVDNTWCDHGAGGVRPDGSKDGGDALELSCRVTGKSRSEALREAAEQMRVEALEELQRATRERRGPLRWVAAIMPPARSETGSHSRASLLWSIPSRCANIGPTSW